MRFTLILVIVLAAYWQVLSGHTAVLIWTLGAISIAAVVGLCARMKILDMETVPYQYTGNTLVYLVWLFKEIIKANVEVAKAVMSPEMKVSPTIVKIPTTQDSELAKTMFANSITLTPGTVSVEMHEGEILVHALLKDMSAPSGFEEMGTRSGWSVGEPLDRSKLPKGDAA